MRGRARRREAGYSLPELLVALLLLAVVLAVASLVEFTLLRRLDRERKRVPGPELVLAARRIGKDIRQATDVLTGTDLPSLPGARFLLLDRTPMGPDTFTLYRLEGGDLLRSEYLEDGTAVGRERVVARNVLDFELEWAPSLNLLSVSVGQARGGTFRASYALRTHPSVLPPMGRGGRDGEEERDGEREEGGWGWEAEG